MPRRTTGPLTIPGWDGPPGRLYGVLGFAPSGELLGPTGTGGRETGETLADEDRRDAVVGAEPRPQAPDQLHIVAGGSGWSEGALAQSKQANITQQVVQGAQ